MGALGYMLMPFCFVCRNFFGFVPDLSDNVHRSEIIVEFKPRCSNLNVSYAFMYYNAQSTYMRYSGPMSFVVLALVLQV